MTEIVNRIPRATRYLETEYLAVAGTLAGGFYLNKTEGWFITQCIRHSNGTMTSARAKTIYYQLMYEAGLEPL